MRALMAKSLNVPVTNHAYDDVKYVGMQGGDQACSGPAAGTLTRRLAVAVLGVLAGYLMS